MSLVDYGDRGVPNVFLEAPLTSNGPWNAARFKNKTYDGLVKQYVAARRPPDAEDARRQDREPAAAGDARSSIPYFIDGLTATTSSVHGVNPTSISAIYLKDAYKTA